MALGTVAPVASVTVPSNLALTACDQPVTAVAAIKRRKHSTPGRPGRAPFRSERRSLQIEVGKGLLWLSFRIISLWTRISKPFWLASAPALDPR